MEEVVLYSTHCPKCMVLEMKLKKANINYKTIDDVDIVVNIGKENNILSAPFIFVNGNYKEFTTAVQ